MAVIKTHCKHTDTHPAAAVQTYHDIYSALCSSSVLVENWAILEDKNITLGIPAYQYVCAMHITSLAKLNEKCGGTKNGINYRIQL